MRVRRRPFVSLALHLALLGALSMLAAGCFGGDAKVASKARKLALELMPDQEEVNSHLSALAETVSLDKEKASMKEVQGGDVEKVKVCYMKYTIGESDWGIVPGAKWDCEDDDAGKREKKSAQRWLAERTEADRVVSEAEYLRSSLEHMMSAVAMASGSGFDLYTCVTDGIDVLVDVQRDLYEERCAVATEGVVLTDVMNLDDPDSDDDDDPRAKLMKWARGLDGEAAVQYLFLERGSYASACWKKALFDNDDVAKLETFGDALEVCAKAAAASK